MRAIANSQRAFEYGKKYIPDGVSSPMRAFKLVGGNPLCVSRAEGSRIYDVDDNEYIDYLCSFGATLVGHSNREVNNEIVRQLESGSIYGLTAQLEYDVAEQLVNSSGDIDQVRFVCSGTEAVMTAVRIARAHTGRNIILKFVGSYHGHADALLQTPVSVDFKTKGSTIGLAQTKQESVILCTYNNSEELESIFKTYGSDIAAVLVEPIATNMGLVVSNVEFLKSIRSMCSKYGSLFIADEVVTGFRFSYGPYTSSLGLEPDLFTFGKIIGGGLPVGAYGGKREYMQHVAIGNSVFQSGTFAANPLTLSASKATLSLLSEPGFYAKLEDSGIYLKEAIAAEFKRLDIPFYVSRKGALLGVSYRDSSIPMQSYSDVRSQDYDLYAQVHQRLLDNGVLLAPSLEEPIFLGSAHTRADFDHLASSLALAISDAMQEKNSRAKSA
ncbi:MAG: glutamate-1-semialdehyde 2,1-aminomutase [Acidiferrobacterales bacterium]|nr:glutamate-1-semialdehyde 2,1-aminomutase [Acidiferrobacterales bacterium]